MTNFQYTPNRPLDFPSALPQEFVKLIEKVADDGERIETRLGRAREVVGYATTVHWDSMEHIERLFVSKLSGMNGMKPTLKVGRIYLGSVSIINEQVEAMKHGVNGPMQDKWGGQQSLAYAQATAAVPSLAAMLTIEPTTRQACVVLSADTCWTSFQIMRRYGRVIVILNARSVDVVDGLLSDLLFWHRHVGSHLNAIFNEPVDYRLNIGSMHLYDDDVSTTSE